MISLEPKTKKLLRKILKILGILFVTSIVLWFVAINSYLTRQEKQRFVSASAELEKLSQEIQEKIGPAASIEDSSSCDRPNLKFAKGSLSCNVGTALHYEVTDSTRANELLALAKSISTEEIRKGPFAKDVFFISSESQSDQTLYQDIPPFQNLSCSISYRLGFEDAKNVLSIHLSCGSSARAEHYPLED